MSNWFPTGTNGNSDGWRLDIVSLLAVIGENSIESHSQALTSSWTCMLPRIIPAPQVLLKPTRPNRMPHVNATICGVHSGSMVPTLNYFPNIIHPVDDLLPFSFKVLRITHRCAPADSRAGTNIKDTSKTSSAEVVDLENGPGEDIRRRATFKEKVVMRIGTNSQKKPSVPPQTYSPLIILSWVSFLVTLGLFIAAAVLRDGTACVAVGSISMVSSLVGYASLWKPKLMNRTSNSRVPPGDVIIRTREGAFILILCNENVARELYFGTEECSYQVPTQRYRILVGLGTFMLMISVVLLGNCDFAMQAAIASSYILLNGAFWAVSLIPKEHFWDLTAYVCEDITPPDGAMAHLESNTENQTEEDRPNFTRTMWYAIRETKKIGWVKRSGAAPETEKWAEWLKEAEEQASINRQWNAVRRRDEIVGGAATAPTAREDNADPAEQHAPALEVPAAEVQETRGI